tara:strand:- start:9335 stop:11731 length:2397 start_codon:yes stop_codon:yes gene_type:complete
MSFKNTIHDCRKRIPIWELFGVLGLRGAETVQAWAGGGGEAKICSPFREDRSPSFSVFVKDGIGLWKDHGTGDTGDEVDLIERARGLSNREAIQAYYGFAGLDGGASAGRSKPVARKTVKKRGPGLADKMAGCEVEKKEKAPADATREIVEIYDYEDAGGELLHQTIRYHPKDFRQRRPAAADEDGEWVWTLKDSEVVPYRLPEILGSSMADPVFLVEGEKDVDRLRELSQDGLPVVATCLPMGAGKWRPEFAKWFAGRWVVVVPDYDVPGLEGAEKVARELFEIAGRVGILELENLWSRAEPGHDVGDWREWNDSVGVPIEDQGEDLFRAAEAAGLAGLDFFGEVIRETPSGVRIAQDRLARNLVKEENLMYCGDHFWKWRGARGLWEKVAEKTWIERTVRRKIAAGGGEMSITSSLISSVVALARSEKVKFPEELNANPGGRFSVRNGMLDLETGKLFPHRMGDFTTVQIPHVYDPAAECPRWLEWLAERQEDPATRAQIQEIFGYCLGTQINYHSFFFFYGEGGTGKSTCVDVLEWLVGTENKVALELTELDNPFTRSQLVGKSLYLAKELTTKSFKHIGLIKAIVSGDPTYVDVKYGDGFDFRPKGRLVMESNVIAATPDSSGGFERRFIQVNFDKMIDRKGMEYNFQERFKAEMSGILNWALEGYRRLVKRGRFEHTTRSQEATDELLKHRAGLASFLKAGWVAECEDDGTRGVRVDRLFALYNDWCELEDVVPHHKEKSTFARELFTIKREWKPRKRRRWFTGEVRDTFILGIEAAEGELRSADVSEGGSEG